jgi:hypothetical protein
MSRLLLLSSLVVLGVGCAGVSAHSNAMGAAMPLGYQGDEPLALRGEHITGPTSSMVVTDNGMNGRFRDRPMSLSWTYQELTGVVGSGPTRLELEEGDETRISGSFGGVPVDLTLKGEWLAGRVGDCTYALERVAGGFEGDRSCGGPLAGKLNLAFPEPLLERPLGEKAALVTLMLANYGVGTKANVSMATFARAREGQRNAHRCQAPRR